MLNSFSSDPVWGLRGQVGFGGRPRSVKTFEQRATKQPKSRRGRLWSGKLFGSAVCQEPRSGLSVPSRPLIHPVIQNEFRLK